MSLEKLNNYMGDYRKDFPMGCKVMFEGEEWEVYGYFNNPRIGDQELALKSTKDGRVIQKSPYKETITKIG